MTLPIFLYDKRTGEYFRYSQGANILQFNYSCCHNHNFAFEQMTEAEYLIFLNQRILKEHIEQISKEDFEAKLFDALFYIANRGTFKTDYWTKEQIKLNNFRNKNNPVII